jgi:hypothetical protein
MSKRQLLPWLVSLALPALHAQYAAPPSGYTVTESNSMMGAPSTATIYRNGSKAVVDREIPSRTPGGKATRMHTLYDLDTHQQHDWDPSNTSLACGASNFSGDWGDPFASSAELHAQLAAAHPTDAGTDTVNGMAAKVVEAVIPQGKARVWLDPKYGLILKFEFAAAGGARQPMIEVKQVSFAMPPASLFVMPATCKSAGPPPPTDAELIAADTGGNVADFAIAMQGPGSANSCTVLLRVVRAVSMAPIASGFQVAIDTKIDADHPAHYTIGLSNSLRATFSGGGLHEVTGQLQNGVLRIENPPEHFEVDMAFGSAGSSSSTIYRQCYGPQTVLLYVVKNPAKLSDGAAWLYVKSGKYAGAAGGR